jgi:acyl-CoA thioesterase-1
LTKHAILLLTLALSLSCGTADDAGNTRSGSTDDGAPAASPRGGRAEAAPSREDPSAPRTAPHPRPRAVFLGTSLTAGYGLADESDRFTDLLQARADSAGIAVEVVNAGVGGETSAGGLRRLEWALRDGAAVLFIELGANDGLRGQSVPAMKQNLDSIIVRARARLPEVRIVLAGMEAPPNLGPRYTSEFRQAFRDLAEDRGVALVPFLLEGVGGVPELNQSDRIHPNPEGHRAIASLLWPFLEPLFREAAAGGVVAP